MDQEQRLEASAAEQILGAAEAAPTNLSDFEKMLVGAGELGKRFEVNQAILIVAAKGQAPIVLGTGKDLAVSYALVTAAANGLHHAVVTQACGGESEETVHE